MYKVTNEQLRALCPITRQFTRGLICIPATNSLANSLTSNLQHMHQGVLVNSISQLIGLALDDYAKVVERLSIEGLESQLEYEDGEPKNTFTGENNRIHREEIHGNN